MSTEAHRHILCEIQWGTIYVMEMVAQMVSHFSPSYRCRLQIHMLHQNICS